MPTEYGVTPNGFVLKRLADIVSDFQTTLSTVQDPVSGEYLVFDPASDDPFNQIVNTLAASLADAWELGQMAYNSRDPLKATGVALDELAQQCGVTRKIGTKSTVSLTCTGTAGAVVPVGQVVTDINATNSWTTTQAMLFGNDGTCTVMAECSVRGAITAAAATLTVISTPNANWQTVINPFEATPGVDDERDIVFRRRILASSMAPSSGPIDAVRAALLQIQGVTYARVYQNRTLEVDARGLLAKSIGAVVLGGEDADIGLCLYLRNAVGMAYSGNTQHSVTDMQGISTVVSWYRPTAVNIYVTVNLTVVDASVWPSDGAAQIISNILAYAQQGAQGLNIATGFDQTGFAPGATVVVSELYTPVNSVPGASVTSLTAGTSAGVQGTTDIAIEWNQLATFLSNNITVNVTPLE